MDTDNNAKGKVITREESREKDNNWDSEDNSFDKLGDGRDSSLSSHDSDFAGGQKSRRKKGRGHNHGGNGEDAKNRRLEKNRQSAKESRLRKKQYIGHLEERNKMLEK